jgi:hypothetical protein
VLAVISHPVVVFCVLLLSLTRIGTSVGEAHLSVAGAAARVLGFEDGHVDVDVVMDDEAGLGHVPAESASGDLDDQSGVGAGSGEEDGVNDRRV